MSNKLYTVRFYGLNSKGETLFDRARYVTSANKAKEVMEEYTNEFDKTLHSFLYPSRVSLYVHLIVREMEDGEYKYRNSGIYSYHEGETYTNKENELFKNL